MYEGWTALIIVFLTHLAIMFVPASGIVFIWIRALVQAGIVLGMHGGSESKWGFMIEWSYWGLFALWAFIKVQLTLQGR